MTNQGEKSSPKISEPAAWLEKHGDALYRYAFSRVGDRPTAEDLVQDTFVAALRARDNFSGRSEERTWFVGILKRKVVDHFRKSSRQAALTGGDVSADESELEFKIAGVQAGNWKTGHRPTGWIIDPTDAAERKEFWRFLRRCLDELPDQMSRAFILRELEELPPAEICNTLDLQPTNLRVIMYRARKQLRRCLEINWMQSTRETS